MERGLRLDVERIHIAHEFVLDENQVCAYPNGRGRYGLIYAIEGEAEFRFFDGNRLVCGEGQVLLLSPDAAYQIRTKGAFRHVTVNFQIHEESSLWERGEPFLKVAPTRSGQYAALFRETVALWRRKPVGYEGRVTAYLYEILSMLEAERSVLGEETGAYRRLLEAKEYLDSHFDRSVTVEELARMSNMSATHFRREWQRVFGQTAMQYRDRVRLSYAEEYLRSGYYTVSEVAERCGFEDVSYFVRFFRHQLGLTPGEYKKRTVSP